ncbi:glycoside hydrolase family 43 protein [Kineococcus endophyticus]|uniref:Glycoside hydrolase family 43 protein n=1 Tax=Kineococcus endophyticus TaxID=1181883 RepID=A0ABV3P4A6_9ACTN
MGDTGTDRGDDREEFGWLLAHFREDPDGHAEKIHFSLSQDDSPLRWDPLWGGGPVLESRLGTTGVRDPAIVRDDDGRFHLLATDLRVWDGGGLRWEEWRRHGSRSLVLWDSEDLLTWEGPRLVEVAPPTAGMAWAPEVTTDPATGEHVVFWSSRLFPEDDVEHASESYSRILASRTRDFVAFGPTEVMVDTGGRDIIDTAVLQEHGRVYRFSKDEDRDGGYGIFLERGSALFADDFEVVTTNIAGDRYPGGVEAPLVVKARDRDRWYLFLDQYAEWPQGYFALQCDDLDSGRWEPVPAGEVSIPPSTKHGTVLPLFRDEWERLREHGLR